MKFHRFGGEKITNLKLTVATNVDAVPDVTKLVLARFIQVKTKDNNIQAILVKPVTPEVVAFVEEKTGNKCESHDEAFEIKAEDKNIVVYAADYSGIRCGIMTFLRLLNNKSRFNYRAKKSVLQQTKAI